MVIIVLWIVVSVVIIVPNVLIYVFGDRERQREERRELHAPDYYRIARLEIALGLDATALTCWRCGVVHSAPIPQRCTGCGKLLRWRDTEAGQMEWARTIMQDAGMFAPGDPIRFRSAANLRRPPLTLSEAMQALHEPPPAQKGSPFMLDRALIGQEETTERRANPYPADPRLDSIRGKRSPYEPDPRLKNCTLSPRTPTIAALARRFPKGSTTFEWSKRDYKEFGKRWNVPWRAVRDALNYREQHFEEYYRRKRERNSVLPPGVETPLGEPPSRPNPFPGNPALRERRP